MKLRSRLAGFACSIALILTTFSANATTDYFVRASASNTVITFPGTGSDTNTSFSNLTSITASSSAGPASSLPLNSASAISKLDSASIRGAVSVTSVDGKQADGSFGGEIRDYLTFDLPDGINSALITAVFDISGELSASRDLSTGGLLLQSWDINGTLKFGSENASGNGLLLSQPDFEPLFSRQLTAELLVTDGVPVFISAKLSAILRAIAGGMLFDFNAADTNQISFLMPAGTSFESASGAFLTAVPLPASVWLFVVAVGAIVYPRRSA